MRAIPEAFRKGWQAFWYENYITQSRAVEAMTYKKGFAIKGLPGKLARLGYRGVTFADELMHTLSRQSSLHAQAYRLSAKETAKKGGTLRDMIHRIPELAKNPTFTMANEATREALVETQRMRLGETGRAFSVWINKQWNPLKLTLVFLRTPVNLIKWGFKRSPVGILRNIHQIVKATDPGVRADVIGQMMAAQLVNAYVAYQVIEGNITGCLSYDKNKRMSQIRAGIKPYSIKIGDKWYAYGVAQPLGTQMATVANLVTKIVEGKKVGYDSWDKEAESIATATISNLKSATYLTGIRDLTRAFELPQVYGRKFVSKFIVSFTPRVAMWTQRVLDPTRRAPENIIEQCVRLFFNLRNRNLLRLDLYLK